LIETWLVAGVVFLGVFTQSLTGFGVALVSMALLPDLIGIRMASPLVALVSLTIEVVLLVRYHQSVELRPVLRITAASLVGIPLGIASLQFLDENLVLGILGLVVAGYALYALSGVRLPELKHPAWPYLAGLVGGFLGGAYNTSGPPVIIYGNCARWEPVQFKSNLQGYFLFSSLVVLGGHFLSHNLTAPVLQTYLRLLPVIGLAVVAGLLLDGRVSPQGFRRLVLVALVVMGIRLML
jgi:uncharacterized membrane protein YfcA